MSDASYLYFEISPENPKTAEIKSVSPNRLPPNVVKPSWGMIEIGPEQADDVVNGEPDRWYVSIEDAVPKLSKRPPELILSYENQFVQVVGYNPLASVWFKQTPDRITIGVSKHVDINPVRNTHMVVCVYRGNDPRNLIGVESIEMSRLDNATVEFPLTTSDCVSILVRGPFEDYSMEMDNGSS